MVLSFILRLDTVTPDGTESVTAYHHMLSPSLLVIVTDPDELDPVSVAGTGDGVLTLGLDPGDEGVDPLDDPKLDPKSKDASPFVLVIQPSHVMLSPLSLVICTERG